MIKLRVRPRMMPRQFELLESRRLMALDPSPVEQELMQLTNRFRSDPPGEFARLMSSASPAVARDKNVDDAIKFFNVDGNVLQAELAALSPIQPLAWNEGLYTMGADYTQLMITNNSQSHNLQGSLGERLARYGFNGSNITAGAENLYKNAFSPVHAHASYVIDWGTGSNGMQSPRGHRNNLMRADFNAAATPLTSTPYNASLFLGPYVSAEEMVRLTTIQPMFVGAIFEDRNGSGWYDAGEGLSGIQVTFQGTAGTFTTNAMSAGGYQIQVPAGTYTATASGGGLRFPVVVPNVQLGSSGNVWLNFTYNATVVPPDSFEPNNSPSNATILSGGNQSLPNLSVPTGDIDYFRLNAQTTGNLQVAIQFTHAQGNLDLRVLDSSGNTLSRSATSADGESISQFIQAGQTYYVVVENGGSGNAGPYSLQVTPPLPQPPIARNDTANGIAGGAVLTIPVLNNDLDPDGSIANLQVSILQNPSGNASVVNQRIVYTPPAGFGGRERIQYQIMDPQGLSSAAFLDIVVINLSLPNPYQNVSITVDSNGDGSVSSIDALLVINELNVRSARRLPTTPELAGLIAGFVDVNGDLSVSAIDALMIINRLNNPGGGEGEASQTERPLGASRAIDIAMEELSQSPDFDATATTLAIGSTTTALPSSTFMQAMPLVRIDRRLRQLSWTGTSDWEVDEVSW